MPITSTPGEGNAGLNIYQLGQIESGYFESIGIAPGTPIDSLTKSEQEALILNLLANNPLLLFNLSNLFSGAYANATSEDIYLSTQYSIESKKDEILSAMLDAWLESIAVEAEISKEASKKQELTKEEIKKDEEKRQVIKEFVEWKEKQPDSDISDAAMFDSYLRYLVQNHRIETLTNTINLMVDNYFSKTTLPVVEDSDLSRALLSAVVLQTLVISPAAQNVILQPIDASSLSTQIGVNPSSDQTFFQPTQFPHFNDQVLPAINFFALDLAKDVSITLYLKQQPTGKPVLDEDFANSFADKVLSEVGNKDGIKEKLIQQIPGFENMGVEKMNDAVTYTQLFGLASALALLVKVDGGTLQENELKEMLVDHKGLTPGEKREDLVNAMNEILQGIPLERRAEFVEALLKYVSSMPDPENLTDFMTALNAASQEVTMGERAVQTRRD